METNQDSRRRLFEDSGAAHAALLHCPECRSALASNHVPHPSFQWGLILSCGRCQTRWVICTLCSSNRKHMLENSLAPQRHNKLKHGGHSKASIPNRNPTSYQSSSMPNVAHLPTQSESSILELTPDKFPPELFSRPQNCRFFEQQAKGNGVGYLVGLANFGKDNISKMLDPQDIDMFVSLAHYCSTQTRPQREQVSEVLDKACQATQRHIVSGMGDVKPFSSPHEIPRKVDKKADCKTVYNSGTNKC